MRQHFSVADEVFTFPLMFSEKQTDAVEQVRVTLSLKSGKAAAERSLLVPIEKFVQKTKLVFPFKGPAIVTQGRFNNGGHLHRETIFAIDVMALTPTYAPMLSEEDRNEAIAGDPGAGRRHGGLRPQRRPHQPDLPDRRRDAGGAARADLGDRGQLRGHRPRRRGIQRPDAYAARLGDAEEGRRREAGAGRRQDG